MFRFNRLIFGTLSVTLACAVSGQAFAQAGPGASVEWTVGPDDTPTVFYDAPAGYEKHYRVCFKKMPETNSVELVMSDRVLVIVNEDCVDLISNRIAVKMRSGTAAATGIFFLIE